MLQTKPCDGFWQLISTNLHILSLITNLVNHWCQTVINLPGNLLQPLAITGCRGCRKFLVLCDWGIKKKIMHIAKTHITCMSTIEQITYCSMENLALWHGINFLNFIVYCFVVVKSIQFIYNSSKKTLSPTFTHSHSLLIENKTQIN